MYFILDDEHQHWVTYAIFIKCPVSKPIQTPIEIKDDDFKEASTTKNTPAFKSGVTTAQLRPKKEQTGRFGSDKKQRKPIFERLQSKWCAQISTDPEESRENTGAAEEKGATTVQLRPEEEQTKRNGCDKKQRKPIFERFQPKWSARVSVGPEESRGNTGATGEKESPKLVASEEQTGCHDSEKKPQLDLAKHLQLKDIEHISMTVGQRSKDLVSEEEEGLGDSKLLDIS
ncbi:hypothetical protein ACRRTK_012851 [Alexandromys fortis]